MKRAAFHLFALIIVVSAAGLSVRGQAPQQRRTAEEYIKLLESESRISGLQIDRVISVLKISEGLKVADVGSGSGLFTRPLAKAVGESGIVYAVDVDPALLKHVDKTAAESGLKKIRTVLAPFDDAKIPEKVDLIVIIDTLHHIENQGPYLKKLRQYLKPGGRLALIDFSKEWPAGHESMRYSTDDLEKWIKAAGFKQVEKFDFLDNNYFLVYQ